MDNTIFNKVFSKDEKEFIFEDKKWNYITDNSNGGNYGTGQVIFDATTLMNGWVNWSEAVLTVPLVLTLTGSLTADATNAFAVSLKNGYYQIIDSIVVNINGKTHSNLSRYTNIHANYKILSSWSSDDERNLGYALGFCKDVDGFTYGVGGSANYGLGETNNAIHQATGQLAGGYNLRTVGTTINAQNRGRLERMRNTSSNIEVGNYQSLVKNAGQFNTNNKNYCAQSTSTSEVVYYVLATIRLKDICNLVENLPLMKGARMEFIVQCNTQCSTQTSISGTTVIGYNKTTYSTVSNGVVPYMISPCLFNSSAYGLNPITTAGTVMKVGIGIARSFGATGSYTHAQTTCRLYAPVYELSPSYEQQLNGMIKKVVYNDVFSSQFLNVAIGGQFQYNIPSLISKPRYLLICPYLSSTTNGGDSPATGGTTNGVIVGSPMNSPFSSAPATTSPYLTLSNFNVFISGKAIYNSSRNYNWEQFLLENRPSNNINGGLTDSLSCGLLNQYDFENGYGFIYVDLSKHSLASDLQQHQLSITGTNNNLVPMDLYVFVSYSKSFDLSVSNGQVIE